jgi:hypothetical protein
VAAVVTTIFCFVCKRHIEVAEIAGGETAIVRFRACGHDDRPVPQLQRGLVGYYLREDSEALHAPSAEVVECFENHERIAA